MKRNEEQVNKRRELVKLAVNDTKAAAEQIRQFANEIEKSQGTLQIVRNLADMLGVHEATVFRDLQY